MKQIIYKAAIGLALMTGVADAASAQTIFSGMRSKRTKSNFKAPVVYSVSKADTSLSFDLSEEKAKRDSVAAVKRLKNRADSLANSLATNNSKRIDSIALSMKDPAVRGYRDTSDTVKDTIGKTVDAKLTAIQDELQNIKTVLRNQALIPRYRYMRYQLDSLNRLTTRLNQKPGLQPAERLQVRVYQLQQDSIRNEMQKLMWISQYPAKDFDSAALNFDYYNDMSVNNYQALPDHIAEDHSSADTELTEVTVTTTDTVYRSATIDTKPRNYRNNRDSFLRDSTVTMVDSVITVSDSKIPTARISSTDIRRQQSDSARISDSIRIDGNKPIVGNKRIISNKRIIAGNRNSDSLRRQDSAAAVYNARIMNLQTRLDSMEQVAATSSDRSTNIPADTGSVKTEEMIASKSTVDSLDSRLRKNTDSLAAMQASLKAVRDSAAYYRRTIYAMDLDPADTVVEKKKWYNRILPTGKKQKAEAKEVETARLYTTQESNFANQAKTMSNDIERLQRDNQSLKNDYDRLRRNRDDRYVRQAPATLIQAGASAAEQRELNAMRREISEMRLLMAQANNTGSTRDTVVMQMPQTASSVTTTGSDRDSAQIIGLQSDLASLRKQLDSIRRSPAPAAAAPAPKTAAPATAAYDVSSFPVISVYFAMNAATLPATQTGKISPMVSVAQKNSASKIILSGFTDPVGNVATNKALATKRINFVRDLLISKYKLPVEKIIVEEPEISATRGVKKANPLDRRVDLRFE